VSTPDDSPNSNGVSQDYGFIGLPDTVEQQNLAQNAVGSRYGVRVWERSANNRIWEYCNDADLLWEVLLDHPKINHRVVYVLLKNVEMCRCVLVPGTDAVLGENGRQYRLYNVQIPGCVVRMTAKEIAEQAKLSQPYVRKQLKLLESAGVLLFRKNGEQEFDAEFVWKGRVHERSAYVRRQRERLEECGRDYQW